MLTKFSFGNNVSSATFRELLGEETRKVKTKLIYFSCIAIIVGSFDFEFKGISGVITFSSDPPTFLIGGILGFAISFYILIFLFYLWDDYLKWDNDIIIENTGQHWDTLGQLQSASDELVGLLSNIERRIEEISSNVYFSADFIEKEDEYLKNALGGPSYETLVNYLKGAKGISLREFREKTRPFCQKLGDEAAKYLLEKKIKVDVPNDVTLYAAAFYLEHVLELDIHSQTNRLINISNQTTGQYSEAVNKFQNNNLGLSINQWVMFIVIEFVVPIALAIIGVMLVFADLAETYTGILTKVANNFT